MWDFLLDTVLRNPEHLAMNPEFAAAMVTVIPVIILLAGVEVNAALNRREQNQRLISDLVQAAQERCLARIHAGETPDDRDLKISRGDFAYIPESSRTAALYWGTSCAAAFLAEWVLIYWLATDEKPRSSGLAWFIAFIACNGFACVLMGMFDIRSDRKEFKRLVEANSQPPHIDPALLPWLLRISEPPPTGPPSDT
ncbi:hypothetical protein [Streptomyces clavuligerus]|nr:hypothetical protein [Streptomyces clavuligerus]EDY52685.1 hypothetical protein SSCG_05728 [Streptomyces clavuligerus]WDN56028.1 hypothetical protein LL058_29530 [Streptomyces clavuligerus]